MEKPDPPSTNERCYVFMDESGDAGLKVGSGSSPDLCLAIVIFRSPESMSITERAIHDLKQEMGEKQASEFHFNHESERVRLRFCNGVSQCPFTIRALTVDKSRIYENAHLRQSPKHFYNFLTRMLFQHTFGAISDANLYIDGNIDRELKTYLRQQLNSEDKRIIRETKFKDSKTTPLIQLADMVAGSVARAYRSDAKRDDQYFRILRPRVEDVWEFGKNR
jgi:hypothetical protein